MSLRTTSGRTSVVRSGPAPARAAAGHQPFADASFGPACSACGALPFVDDTTRVHRVADGAYDKVLALLDGH
jgi:hypothetical protein